MWRVGNEVNFPLNRDLFLLDIVLGDGRVHQDVADKFHRVGHVFVKNVCVNAGVAAGGECSHLLAGAALDIPCGNSGAVSRRLLLRPELLRQMVGPVRRGGGGAFRGNARASDSLARCSSESAIDRWLFRDS